MAGLDLSGVKRFVEAAILVDTVVAGRSGIGDDDVDQDTGQTYRPDDIYLGTDTAAALLSLDSTALGEFVLDPDIQVILERSESRARLLLGISTILELEVGDHVWATTANAPVSDAELIGYEWEVAHRVAPSSFSVTRTYLLKSATPAWGRAPVSPVAP